MTSIPLFTCGMTRGRVSISVVELPELSSSPSDTALPSLPWKNLQNYVTMNWEHTTRVQRSYLNSAQHGNDRLVPLGGCSHSSLLGDGLQTVAHHETGRRSSSETSVTTPLSSPSVVEEVCVPRRVKRLFQQDWSRVQQKAPLKKG